MSLAQLALLVVVQALVWLFRLLALLVEGLLDTPEALLASVGVTLGQWPLFSVDSSVTFVQTSVVATKPSINITDAGFTGIGK